MPGVVALLIVSYGYGVLFALALFFILISIIPVLPLRHEQTDFHFSWSEVKNITKRHKQFILSEILDNLGQDAQVIWTLFVFITGLTVLDIGVLGIITGLVGMAVTFVTGRLIDKWDKKKVMRLGAIVATIMWIISYIIAIYQPTPLMLYIVTALRGFAVGIFATSYGAIMFNRARSDDAQFLVLREVPTILGRVLLFVITLILISIGKFELSFTVVAILSLYFWFNNIDTLTEKTEASSN